MPRYQYQAKDNQGQSKNGIVEASSEKNAVNLLHDQGFFIVSMNEASGGFTAISGKITKVSFGDLVYITRQLSTMITAGLTLIEALNILRQQVTKPALIKLITQLEEDIQGGLSFADSLAKYPKIFPPIYLALVRAGEASGKLDSILSRLADNLEKNRDFRNKIKSVMTYPVVIVTGMSIVGVVVMTVVIPRLTGMYKDFGIELPLPTMILISISDFLVQWGVVTFIGLALVIGLFMRWARTKTGKHAIDSGILMIPVIGNLIKESTLVEVTRTLSILIDGGVPILTALEIAQNATGNVIYKDAFDDATKRVEKGFPLSKPLLENSLFPPIFGQMVAVGEQTGKVGDSLMKIANYFESETEQVVRSLTTLIEPFIMVILGIGVGFLVMAVLLPIYSLTSKF